MVRDYELFLEALPVSRLDAAGPVTIDLGYVTSARPYQEGRVMTPADVSTFSIVTVVGADAPLVISERFAKLQRDLHMSKLAMRG